MNDCNLPRSEISEILKEFEPKRENLIPILLRIQGSTPYNYIPGEAVKTVAKYVGATDSEVCGIITFYTMFSDKPRGLYLIRVCESAPCHVMGSTTVVAALEKILKIPVGRTTKDQLFTLELSSCLGLCDRAPVMMINDEIYGNLTTEKIGKIIKEIKKRGNHG